MKKKAKIKNKQTNEKLINKKLIFVTPLIKKNIPI